MVFPRWAIGFMQFISNFMSKFLVCCNDHRCSLVKLAGIVVVAYFRWVKDLNKFVWRVAEIEISWRRPCRCQNGNRKVEKWVLVVWMFEVFLRRSETEENNDLAGWFWHVLFMSFSFKCVSPTFAWLDAVPGWFCSTRVYDLTFTWGLRWLSWRNFWLWLLWKFHRTFGTWSIDELVLMQGA